ncbi:MAG: hypothetical protein U1E23_00550 [Reyranellaceae bacterium]
MTMTTGTRRRAVLRLAALAAGASSLPGLAMAQFGSSSSGNLEGGSGGPPGGGRPGGGQQGGPPGGGPPFEQIARDLGLSTDKVRAAFRQVGPPSSDGPPTDQQMAAHAQKLASALGVSVDKLRPVLDKYRPPMPPRS